MLKELPKSPRSQSMRFLQGMLLVGALAGSHAALASPNRTPSFDSTLANELGTPVPSMPNASSILSWMAEDSYHVLIEVAPTDTQEHGVYRLTFTEACYNLRWANSVGLSESQNQVWAGFDYLTADDQRCSISAIYRL